MKKKSYIVGVRIPEGEVFAEFPTVKKARDFALEMQQKGALEVIMSPNITEVQ